MTMHPSNLTSLQPTGRSGPCRASVLAYALLGFWFAGLATGGDEAAMTSEAPDRAAVYQSLIDKVAPSVVTMRMVVKVEANFGGRGSDSERRREVPGTLVGADGMILCSYEPFRSVDTGQFSVKVTPLEIKVVFDREEKEYEAELVATDKKVNLAFLKIKDLEGRVPPVIDFKSGAKIEVGGAVHQVARLNRGYDYAPYVTRSIVNGRVKKPRKAWILDGSIRETGLPVFDDAGTVAGVLTELDSGLSQDESGFGGGMPFVLDAKIVDKLIELAGKQASERDLDEEEELDDAEADSNGG